MNVQGPVIGGLISSPGEGAIHVLRIAGPGVCDFLKRCFWPQSRRSGPPSSRACRNDGGSFQATGGRALRLGQLHDGAEVVDEALVHLEAGAQAAEITTHGGVATQEAVIRLLRNEGVDLISSSRLFGWESWGRRAPAVASEAMQLLTQSWSLEGVLFALEALQGALGREIDSLRRASAMAGDRPVLGALLERARTLLRRLPLGVAFSAPPRLLFAGPPNAGKSSLVNRLLGTDASIVAAAPGTTRDLVKHRIAIEGYPFEIIDSAGLRLEAEGVERAGMERSLEACGEAGVLAFVVPASEEPADFLRILTSCPRRPDILIASKSDLVSGAGLRERLEAGLRRQVHPVSVVSGEGVDALRRAVVYQSPFGGHAQRSLPAPFSRRQAQLLEEAALSLEAASGVAAARMFEEILSG